MYVFLGRNSVCRDYCCHAFGATLIMQPEKESAIHGKAVRKAVRIFVTFIARTFLRQR